MSGRSSMRAGISCPGSVASMLAVCSMFVFSGKLNGVIAVFPRLLQVDSPVGERHRHPLPYSASYVRGQPACHWMVVRFPIHASEAMRRSNRAIDEPLRWVIMGRIIFPLSGLQFSKFVGICIYIILIELPFACQRAPESIGPVRSRCSCSGCQPP